ncbi:ArnT family glycosyltransferase [Leptolyngbya ohadii]|uniref:ArnT family glycosyltransferase n=1 Tax=Leptolyngbya ohadii TaxID=1962290 RepID=UPI000B59ED19|nr:glycosyltransferase family 39 protein [Leptolyngbya ohadii]
MKVEPPKATLPWKLQASHAWIFALVWIGLATGIAFWLHLGSIGLVDETEPLFAEAARQMKITGDWITPYFNGNTRFDKPPLVYWIMAIAYQTVGVNEWSARFPSALAGTFLAVFGFYTLRRFGFSRPGSAIAAQEAVAAEKPIPSEIDRQLWIAALVGSAAMVLNPQTIVWGRTGVSDMLLSGCIGGCLLAFFCGYAQPNRPKMQDRWYLAAYVLSALAVLTKGPVGIVIPGMIVLAFLFYTGNLWTVLRELKLIRGALIFVAITLPWYILVTLANGDAFINSFFGYHNIERFTQVVNRHSAPWYFYFLVVPIAFMPWSIHLPAAFAQLRFWKRSAWQQQPRASHLGIFALIWFAVVFVFFTIAVTKLPSYTIPLLPACAILVALFWSDQMTHASVGSKKFAWISHWVNILVLFALAWATYYSPNWLGNDPELPNLPNLIREAGVEIWGGVAWAVAAIGGIILLLRRQGRWLWVANLVGFVAFVLLTLMPAAALMDVERQLPLRDLSQTIVQVQQPNEPLVMIGFGKPSIVFYTDRYVNFIPDPDDVIPDLQDLMTANPAPPSILVLGRDVKLREAKLRPRQYELIKEAGIYQLVRIRPNALRQ